MAVRHRQSGLAGTMGNGCTLVPVAHDRWQRRQRQQRQQLASRLEQSDIQIDHPRCDVSTGPARARVTAPDALGGRGN